MIHRRILIAVLVLMSLAFTAYLVTEYSLRHSPEIDSMSKLLCVPGEKILIEGNYFGDRQSGSRLFFGQREIKSSHIELWENQSIRFRIPSFEYSQAIMVKTSGGESRRGLVFNREQFPQLQSGSFLPGLPYIEYVDPSSGPSGSLVDLKGYNFGKNRGLSRILVNLKEDENLSYFEDPQVDHYTFPDEGDYLLWENDRIQFYLPDQAQSGFIFIETARGFSNPVYFEVNRNPGQWESLGKSQIMLQQKILIDRIGALEENRFYLWVPKPVSSGNQQNVSLISSNHDIFLSTGNLDLIPLSNLRNSETLDVTRSIVLTLENRHVELDPSRIPVSYNTNRSIFVENTRTEEIYPVQDRAMRNLAVSVTRGVTHPYYRAKRCYQYVLDKLEPRENFSAAVLQVFDRNEADSDGYSNSLITLLRIMGIPARKVMGIRLDEGESAPHSWVEIYFEGFGWFPADPWMADQEVMESNNRDSGFYWGGEDDRRIAFSRGISLAESLDDQSKLQIPEFRYSNQNIYEEKSGNISSLRTQWNLPEEIMRF